MRVIDMRLRPPLPSWKKTAQFTEGTAYYPTRFGFPRPPSVKSQSMDDLLKEMEEAGITWGVIMGRQSAPPHGSVPNDEIAAAIARHPGKFVGFIGVDLRDAEAGVKEIDRMAKVPGFRGASIEPGASVEAMYSDDRRLYPLYERCQALEIPMSITLSGYLSAMAGHDLSYGSPASVYKVAKDFPRLKIVVSHAAWPNIMPMMEVAFIRENVYVSPDLYMNGVSTPGAHEYVKAAHFFLGERLLFGTAYPSRPLKESLEAFLQWELAPGIRDKVLYENAARLMNLE
ncbi:MAG: amidohydrolase family protein [Betaproteobacteria bacterium]|nr:amidohydrolase family protein [Betaproteobacteria bacterium]